MKQLRLPGLVLGLTLACTVGAYSQEQTAVDTGKDLSQNNIRVKQKTLMEKFEPEMVISVEDRTQLKEVRLAEIEKGKQIIDTLNVSERKKKKLMGDLYRSPYSSRLEKNLTDTKIVDTKFEEDDY